MMNEKQVEALKLAREALKLNCSSQTESPATKALAAIDEALADNALDKMADNAKELGLDYEPIVEQVEDSVGMGHGAWDMVEPKKLAKAFHEALAEQPAQQDYWQEEARRYAQNAEFWRGKYEAATAQQQEPWQGLTYDEVAPIIQQYHWLPTAFARAIEAKLRELNEHKEKNA